MFAVDWKFHTPSVSQWWINGVCALFFCMAAWAIICACESWSTSEYIRRNRVNSSQMVTYKSMPTMIYNRTAYSIPFIAANLTVLLRRFRADWTCTHFSLGNSWHCRVVLIAPPSHKHAQTHTLAQHRDTHTHSIQMKNVQQPTLAQSHMKRP